MIGLVLGTGEGREILSLLNEFTDDIFISTVSEYGASLYSEFAFKAVNSSALDGEGFCEIIKENSISIFIDVTHPYAIDVSRNLLWACQKCKIEYVRYERPGVLRHYEGNPNIISVEDYNNIKKELSEIDGTVMNTTGSKNVGKILELNLKNRVIHRVLPTSKVLEVLEEKGVRADDIIAVKMDLNVQNINDALIDAYGVKAILAKDSGKSGGTVEKIEAAIRNNIKIIILQRPSPDLPNKFEDMKELAAYCLRAGGKSE